MSKPEFLKQPVTAKVLAGAWGWLAGSTLGAATDPKPDWRNITFYSPIPDGMIETFPTSCAALYLRGGKDQFGLTDLWRKELKSGPDAYRFAAANIDRGLRAPISGAFQNPFAADGSAVGRGAFWGLLFTGQPATAAAWAWHDAAIDHSGDAVWAAAFWAAAIAAAPFSSSLSESLAIATEVLPSDSELRKLLPAVVQSRNLSQTWQQARDVCLEWGGGIRPESALATHAFALIGCVFGDGDFARAVTVAAGCGGQSISAAGVAGAALGAGTGEVPDDWREPLGDEFRSAVKAPKAISGFMEALEERVLVLAKRAPFALVDELKPAPAPADGEPVAPPPEPDTSFLRDTGAIAHLRLARFAEGQRRLGDLIGSFSYPDGVTGGTSKPTAIGFRIDNPGDEPIEVNPVISASEGWSVVARAGRHRVEPGGSLSLAAVASSQGPSRGSVILTVGDDEIAAPLIGPQTWWVVGPFGNREKEGYDKVYMPERKDDPTGVFADRSGTSIKWQEVPFPGVSFETEGYFLRGPGVVYLSTEAHFDLPGRKKLVVASPVGQVVWINGEKRAWYQDTHTPIPRPVAPYVVEFESRGWTKFLIKLTRDALPVAPTVIYFVDESGRLDIPGAFRQPGTG